ncbi:DNA repair protein RecO [Peptoniphilus raoultii]|uniref:DNA repair protein RecO n=1 Tax=Peptoniphilus raoultii TaxID=1776387 RepID=UPI0008D8D796|nr:DNA repair protein RecO [Peptoniphilus raoultii]
MDINNDFTEGIVINEFKHGESSKILSILTKKYGKISVMGKGAYAQGSSLISLTQLFTEGLYLFKKGQTFYYIKSGRLLSSNYNIRQSFKNLVYASLILEIVDKSTLEHYNLEKIYGLLSKALNVFNKSQDPGGKALAFIIKYMTFMGYMPRLVVYGSSYFSPQIGVTDKNLGEGNKLLSQDIYYLKNLLYTSLDKDINYDDKRKKYLLLLFIKYIRYNLEISDFNSLNFL